MDSREFRIGDREPVTTSCEQTPDMLTVRVGEHTYELLPLGDSRFKVMVNGRPKVIAAREYKGVYYVDIDSVLLEVREPSDDAFAGGGDAAHGEKDKIYAPMPGKVVKVLVEVGQEVTEKQPMVIVEAMKMENRVDSKAAGKVKAVNFKAGDQVDTETPIIELQIAQES